MVRIDSFVYKVLPNVKLTWVYLSKITFYKTVKMLSNMCSNYLKYQNTGNCKYNKGAVSNMTFILNVMKVT